MHGLACAREFLREGAKVSLVARTAARLQDAVAQLRTQGHDAVRGPGVDHGDASAALRRRWWLEEKKSRGG
jgi:short-subunit dehydrogenase